MTITALSRRAMAAELGEGAGAAHRGLPRTDVEVRVVDDAGQPLTTGSPGEVLVRGGVGHEGLLEQSSGHGRDLARGVAAHRRHRLPG